LAGEIALDDVPLALRLNDTFHFTIYLIRRKKNFVFSLKSRVGKFRQLSFKREVRSLWPQVCNE